MTIIDNGTETIDATGEKLDNRSQLLASAARIVAQSVEAEGKIAETAKAWGHFTFAAVYNDSANLDALIGDSKIAAGWATLTVSDAGKKAKQRMEVYFSNARLVAERWTTLTDEQRVAVLNGESSIHYLAAQFRKADAEAKKAAKKAEEAAAAAATASEAASDASVPEAAPLTLTQEVERLATLYTDASADERNAAYDALAMLFELVNSDAEVVAPVEEQIAANG